MYIGSQSGIQTFSQQGASDTQRSSVHRRVDTEMIYCIDANIALLSPVCSVVYPVTSIFRDLDRLQATKIDHHACFVCEL